MVASIIIGVVFLVVLLITGYKSVHVVGKGELEALLVFGEMDAVLEPGINFVPPFVSKTHPIDTEDMVMKTDDGTKNIPQEYIQEIRKSDLG